MLLMIDNHDSFTYNLVQYLRELNCDIKVYLNDEIDIGTIKQLQPSHIIISPGPGNPDQAGISLQLIHHFAEHIPILGVCLGHQCIGQYFGAKITNASQIIHGKVSEISHHQQGLFHNIPQLFRATRYHSLVIDPATLPNCLELSAWNNFQGNREIMAIAHRQLPIFGVQFHPEAILTEYGHQLLKNFLELTS